MKRRNFSLNQLDSSARKEVVERDVVPYKKSNPFQRSSMSNSCWHRMGNEVACALTSTALTSRCAIKENHQI